VPVRSRREIPRVLAALGTQDAAHSLLRAATSATGRWSSVPLWRTLDRIRKHDATVTLPAPVVERHLGEGHSSIAGIIKKALRHAGYWPC